MFLLRMQTNVEKVESGLASFFGFGILIDKTIFLKVIFLYIFFMFRDFSNLWKLWNGEEQHVLFNLTNENDNWNWEDGKNMLYNSLILSSNGNYDMASLVSGQDEPNSALWFATGEGKMALSCPLRTTCCILQEKFPCKRYNESLIDQVWGQDGWILALFYFCKFMDLNSALVHKHAKKERGQYPAILTEQAWSIKDLLYGFRGNFSCGTWPVVPSGQDSSILPARVANHSAGFDSSYPLTELAI